MGNFEKLVVLAVLFLSAIVLAVSLNDDGSEVQAGDDPITAAQARVEEEEAAPASETPGAPRAERLRLEEVAPTTPPTTTPTGPERSWLLSRETKPAPSEVPEVEPARGAAGLPRILKATGLESSASPDTMLYTVSVGDTWNGLAMRFYEDGRYSANLRQANDDRQLRVGDEILVPIYDHLAEAGRDPLRPGRPGDTTPAVGPIDPGAPGAGEVVTPASVPTIGEVYVVKSGDSLSKIAQQAYRDGNKWRAIYDANRDVMRTPDWLQVGMKLVIPDPDQPVATKPVDPNKPRVR